MATPNMVNMAEKLATSKPKNSTATAISPKLLSKPAAPTPSTSKPNVPTSSDMEGKMQSSANDVPNTPTQEMCAKAIKESNDLIDALEHVGEMFGIPKENILCDDTLDGIRVQGDTIIAPAVPVEGKSNAIMKSISAVLDYISQRIDAKLNKFQGDNMERGAMKDHIDAIANPSKGKVLSHHITPECDEIIVYDSGLVDMPNTQSARDFVNNMRANGTIPSPSQLPTTSTGVQYFTDEDDITSGVDVPVMNDTNPETGISQGGSDYGDSAQSEKITTANDSMTPGSTVDIAENINESYSMLSLVSKYGNTKHLGYEMMNEIGINGIQPVDFMLESGEGGKKKEVLPSDIKHMKFDNTHIMKAVKFFNAVRAEQKDVKGKDFDVAKMVNSPNWNKAIQELEKQFDCHIVIHYLKDDSDYTDASTMMAAKGYEYRQNVTVSKSKGFQLNGLPISIYLLNNTLIESTPTDPSLFGQAVTALLLHEIFHNIIMVFREYNTEFNAMLTTTMLTASLTESPKVRRKLLTNFANAVDAMNPPGEKMNIIEKHMYIKKLLILCSLRQSKENMKLAQSLVEEDDNTDIDKYLKAAETFQANQEKKLSTTGLTVGSIIGGAIGASILIGGLSVPTFWLTALGGSMVLGSVLTYKIGRVMKEDLRKDVASRERGDSKDYEEHWADMFAMMYNLPVTFFAIPSTHVVPNKMTNEQIKRLHQIEMKWVTLMNDEHPPTMERVSASVKYAQQTLNSGIKLNPDVKKYLEWIVANYSRILEAEDIDTIYSKATFDPKTAEDIDLHIANLLSRTNSKITEQSVK